MRRFSRGCKRYSEFVKPSSGIDANDATREIVYRSFRDDDPDYVEDPAECNRSDRGWKHIR